MNDWCVTEEFSEPITYEEYIDSIRKEAEIMRKAKEKGGQNERTGFQNKNLFRETGVSD